MVFPTAEITMRYQADKRPCFRAAVTSIKITGVFSTEDLLLKSILVIGAINRSYNHWAFRIARSRGRRNKTRLNREVKRPFPQLFNRIFTIHVEKPLRGAKYFFDQGFRDILPIWTFVPLRMEHSLASPALISRTYLAG